MAKTDSIHIVSDPARRGGKIILVNNEEWGRIEMQSKGPNGNAYHFENAHGATISVPFDPPSRTGLMKLFTVVGDKLAYRQARYATKPGEPLQKPAPLEERLLAAVRDLIGRKLLRSPAALAATAAAHAVRYRAECEKSDAEERAKFEAKAMEIVKLVQVGPGATIRDKIVEAMRWAQTQ